MHQPTVAFHGDQRTVGGNAAGAGLKNLSLGTTGNSIAGAVGGGLGVLLSRALATRVRLARSAFAILIVIVAVYVGWKAAGELGWTA